jgi:LPS-assembly lipoprotein
MKLRVALTLSIAACTLPALSGCGLKPLYGNGAAADSLYGRVEIAPIPGQNGWLMRQSLLDQLGEVPAGSQPAYRLEVVLDDKIEGFGLRSDDSVTRERRTLRARYRLIDVATGAVVHDATLGSDAGIDVASSEYATIAAENTALENLSDKVAGAIVTDLTIARRRPVP